MNFWLLNFYYCNWRCNRPNGRILTWCIAQEWFRSWNWLYDFERVCDWKWRKQLNFQEIYELLQKSKRKMQSIQIQEISSKDKEKSKLLCCFLRILYQAKARVLFLADKFKASSNKCKLYSIARWQKRKWWRTANKR